MSNTEKLSFVPHCLLIIFITEVITIAVYVRFTITIAVYVRFIRVIQFQLIIGFYNYLPRLLLGIN